MDLVEELLNLHKECDEELWDDESSWCVHCVTGWDGEDFEQIRYPCLTVQIIQKHERS